MMVLAVRIAGICMLCTTITMNCATKKSASGSAIAAKRPFELAISAATRGSAMCWSHPMTDLTDDQVERLLLKAGWTFDAGLHRWWHPDFQIARVKLRSEALENPATTLALLEMIVNSPKRYQFGALDHDMDGYFWNAFESEDWSAPTLPEAVRLAALELLDE